MSLLTEYLNLKFTFGLNKVFSKMKTSFVKRSFLLKSKLENLEINSQNRMKYEKEIAKYCCIFMSC